MDLNHLKIIQALVVDPNLSRTAERLHVTQSALSKRVQALEEEIGVPLFERRGPRGLRPLPQAFELAALSQKVNGAWDNGLRRLQKKADEPEHFVLVGPQLFLREVILPWWQKTAHAFPDLTLEVQVSALERVSLETIQTGADAGILEHKEELADFICRPIFTERWGIVRHPKIKHSDFSRYIWGTNSMRNNPVDAWLVKRQKMSPPVYRVYWQDLTALAIWVAETPGAASVLPWHAVGWLTQRKRLVFEPLGPDATTKLYLAYPTQHPHQRVIQALTQVGKVSGLA